MGIYFISNHNTKENDFMNMNFLKVIQICIKGLIDIESTVEIYGEYI